MNYQYVIMLITLSTLIIGCNDDTPSNRFTKKPQTLISPNFSVYSGIHREKGSPPVSYKDEIALNSEGPTLRPMPDIRFDDDGGDGKNATTRTALTRPSFPCGQAPTASLSEKIADCALPAKNGTLAIWEGKVHASSAEGTWHLVTLSEDEAGTYEIWLDKKTGMLWSDILPKSNWCAASGSSLTSTDTIAINCAITGKGQNLCGNYNPAELPKVHWRLPTRHDYLQADLDGIRFVLRYRRGNDSFWSATISSDLEKRDKAWTYDMVRGTLMAQLLDTDHHIRCIGTPNF